MLRVSLLTISLTVVALLGVTPAWAADGGIAWQGWSQTAFDQARRENRFVLLDLGAVWCHWCHVMERDTYGNPAVADLIKARYVPVRVDQDARPDLARRYEDYGWPATVIFSADGREIVKLRGYVPAARMISVLEHILSDSTPITYSDSLFDQLDKGSEGGTSVLSAPVRSALERRYRATHDARRGGLLQSHKYLDPNTVEYGLLRARQGDVGARRMARQTLEGSLNLIDPVWGGAYQYSTHGDWKHIHFEKIMQVQAEYLRVYALSYRELRDVRYRRAAEAIHRYARTFLRSPDGAFYASQDADVVKGRHAKAYFALGDAARRRQGIPAVDRHLYARENGWMITALATLHAATGERIYLDDALVATRWGLDHRALPDGGFRHDAADQAGPYLDDTLAMGRAFLALHAATAEREWLTRAEVAARFIGHTFRDGTRPGYLSAASGGVLKLRPNVEENIAMARFANLLAHYTGDESHRALGAQAMRYLAIEEVATYRSTEPGILLADAELGGAPDHLTVIGPKGDAAARALHRAALRVPGVYRRIEWWDRAEGALPNADVAYPALDRPAAFFCAQGRCSLPVFTPGDLDALAARLGRAASPIRAASPRWAKPVPARVDGTLTWPYPARDIRETPTTRSSARAVHTHWGG